MSRSSGTARVELVCVGTELLSGKVNTHTSTLSRALAGVGLSLSRETAAVDSLAEIRDAVRGALERAEVVLISGGLGPTFDDITREAVSEALGAPLVYHPEIYAAIRAKYLRVYRRIPRENRRQAFVLSGAKVLANRLGSAPGQLWQGARKTVVLFPGPPWELQPMLKDVLPVLKKTYAPSVFTRVAVYHLCGISESAADEKLAPLIRAAPAGVELTILARQGLVDFHITCSAGSRERAARLASWGEAAVKRCVGGFIFGTADDTIESVVGDLLRRRRRRLATAESCTGGLLSARITATPGSSDYYLGGVVSYANAVKESGLGVNARTLETHGAVSAACAREMAQGALRRLGADCAVAITGIAGPGGATAKKPLGLVFIAFARKDGPTVARRHEFSGGREQVRERAVVAALTLLRSSLS